MYLSFIIRLYAVYNNPIFRYNSKILKFICIIIVVWGLFIAIATAITIEPYPYYSDNHSYIKFCKPDIPALSAYAFTLYDIIFSIGSMIAFINPLRNIIKSLISAANSIDGKLNDTKHEINKLMHIGIKYAILTFVASFTTILMMINLALGINPHIAIDWVTNMVCMVLMTKYYDDKVFYERLCCGAIGSSYCCMKCCCGYNKETMELGGFVNRKGRNRVNTDTRTRTKVESSAYTKDSTPVQSKNDMNLNQNTVEIVKLKSVSGTLEPERSVCGFIISKTNEKVEHDQISDEEVP